ncbi:hypothetical protein AOLI_G00000730 [Acnodon oligacanthus]
MASRCTLTAPRPRKSRTTKEEVLEDDRTREKRGSVKSSTVAIYLLHSCRVHLFFQRFKDYWRTHLDRMRAVMDGLCSAKGHFSRMAAAQW